MADSSVDAAGAGVGQPFQMACDKSKGYQGV
jgi:hypothetical protein